MSVLAVNKTGGYPTCVTNPWTTVRRMAATPLLNVRLDPTIVAEIDQAAEGLGVNRSDFVRLAIARELDAVQRRPEKVTTG